MHRIVLFILLALLSQAIKSQGFRVRHYLPSTQTNLSKAMFESTPGNYITGGFVVEMVNNVSCNRLCLMGLGAQGQIVWIKKYGNSKFEYLNNNFISRCFYKKNNNLYYAGCVRDSLDNQIGVLIKFDLNGDTLWQKTYLDPQEDVIPQMVTASVDGGFLMTGFFQNWANNTNPCLLIKTDANGNELWRKKLSKVTPNTQDGQAILQDVATKKIVMVGYQYIGNANSWFIHDNVVITDSLGEQATRFNYTGFGGVLKDVIQTSDQKIVAVGYKYSPQTIGGNNLGRAFAVKFDINNPSQPIWTVEHDKFTLSNAFTCLVELTNGDLLAAGALDTLQMNNATPNNLLRLTKINPNGNVTWNRYYDYKVNAPTSDNVLIVRSINLTNDASAIAAIEVVNFPAPNPFFFVKFDSTGCDSTLAYCQAPTTTVTGVYENKLKDIKVDVFPNPASDYLMIDINNNSGGEDYKLQLMDISGRELKQILLNPDHNSIDLKDLSNGVYMLSLTNNNKLIYTTRLIKKE